MRNKTIRFLGSVLLMGALAAPIALQAQDRDDHHDRDDHNKNHRYYDRDHKDYHQWNSDEDRAYHQWYADRYRGKGFRDFKKLKHNEQEEYWKWRHDHR
jgi:hypothetical protein